MQKQRYALNNVDGSAIFSARKTINLHLKEKTSVPKETLSGCATLRNDASIDGGHYVGDIQRKRVSVRVGFMVFGTKGLFVWNRGINLTLRSPRRRLRYVYKNNFFPGDRLFCLLVFRAGCLHDDAKIFRS